MCPKGDDPVTINQNYRQIQIVVNDPTNTSLTGDIGIKFMGEISYISLTDPSNSTCTDSLETSGEIGTVSCYYITHNDSHYTIDVTFFDWPMFSLGNNLYDENNGNPAITDFYCDVTQAKNETECILLDVETRDIRGKHPHYDCTQSIG